MELDTPLLQLSPDDYFTLRDACQGVSIVGGIGSGKTSGSGAALAMAYLRAGMGGLVLCAKPEEAALWRQYAQAAGRADSLITFSSQEGSFNFLAYELARQGGDGLNSVVECLMRVLEAAHQASPSPGRAGERFWEDTTRQLLRHCIPVLHAATGTVTIADIIRFVRGAPQRREELGDPAWQAQSFFYQASDRARHVLGTTRTVELMRYWAEDFARLDPKTRGNIAISLSTSLDRFQHGWLRRAFCGEVTLVPELCFQGAIILLDMPALRLNEDGIIAQQVFKYLWQRAVLNRNALPPAHRQRPVFLWADECQYFINSYDAEYQSTCRGSRACTVYLTQSLPTFYATIGGEQPRDRAQHLLGNFATRVLHSTSCPETQEWAARTIGRALQRRANYSEGESASWNDGLSRGENVTRGGSRGRSGSSGTSMGPGGSSSTTGGGWNAGSSWGSGENWGENRGSGSSSSTNRGYAEQMDYVIEPAAFGSALMTGGPANGNQVSAIWYQAGRQFRHSGRNFLLARFQQ